MVSFLVGRVAGIMLTITASILDQRGNSAQCPNHGRLSAVSLG
jgi:hypothetical protein